MPDWIKRSDDDFDDQFAQFNAWVQDNGLTHGLTAGQLTALDNAYTAWSPAFINHKAAQTNATAAKEIKDDKRADGEALMREQAATLQVNSLTTDAERMSAGMAVRDGTRTRAAVPTTRPIAMIDTSQRLRHTINFKDETTPNSKKKPVGVMGVEIWCGLGPTPPADASTCSFVALDTSTPYVVEYDGADANKIAHYLLRWVNTRGEKGPWSETASATIGA